MRRGGPQLQMPESKVIWTMPEIELSMSREWCSGMHNICKMKWGENRRRDVHNNCNMR